MVRDPHHARKLCCPFLKFSEPEVGFVINLPSVCPWSQAASLCVPSRTFPDSPSMGLQVTATAARALETPGTAFRREVYLLRDPPSCLPSPHVYATARPGEVESTGRGVELGFQHFQELCLISASPLGSLLMPACFHYLILMPYEK